MPDGLEGWGRGGEETVLLKTPRGDIVYRFRSSTVARGGETQDGGRLIP